MMKVVRWGMQDDEMVEREDGEWVRYEDAFSIEAQRAALGDIVAGCAHVFQQQADEYAAVAHFLTLVGDHATGKRQTVSMSEVREANEMCLKVMEDPEEKIETTRPDAGIDGTEERPMSEEKHLRI